MMKKILLFTLLGSLFFAQQKEEAAPAIYDKYPKGQSDYNGGNIQFYKELHQLIVDKKIQPCENKTELYSVKFVVYPDATIKFVKEEYPEKAEKNKCAFDLTRKLFKYLDGWKPAEVGGQKVAAITSMIIFPDALFDKYTEGYDIINYMVPAKYNNGINRFRSDLMNGIDVRSLIDSGGGKAVILFDINEKGEKENIHLEEEIGNKSFNNIIIQGIKNIKGKWTPEMIHGIPVKSRFRFPITLGEN